jgi:hypothetical protein
MILRMKPCIVLMFAASFALVVQASDNLVEVTLEDGPIPGCATSESDAVAYGKAEAEKDIKAGRLHVKECGTPSTEQEIDSVTGYPIEYIGPCAHRSGLFNTEVRAYNRTMREWHAKHKKRR